LARHGTFELDRDKRLDYDPAPTRPLTSPIV
jgi:hypothetical protein